MSFNRGSLTRQSGIVSLHGALAAFCACLDTSCTLWVGRLKVSECVRRNIHRSIMQLLF